MSVSIWFEGRWPDLNSYIDAERGHLQHAAELKRIYTQTARVQALNANVGAVETPCAVVFTWRLANRKIDPDNTAFACKFILDGLVAAGVLANDGHRQIGSLHHEFAIAPKLDPGVTVTLITVRDLGRVRQARNNAVCREAAARSRGDQAEYELARAERLALDERVAALERAEQEGVAR